MTEVTNTFSNEINVDEIVQTKDSYISTNDLLHYLDDRIKYPAIKEDEKKVLISIIEKIILRTPRCDVRPIVHAKWIKSQFINMIDGKPIDGLYFCSNCRTVGNPRFKYCGCCGATFEED